MENHAALRFKKRKRIAAKGFFFFSFAAVLSILFVLQAKNIYQFHSIQMVNDAYRTSAQEMIDRPQLSSRRNSTLSTISKHSVMAGCLLIRDDNFRLPEWLAFHHHVLPLHRVIVASDPRSMEDPSQIFETFSQELGMNISHWDDGDYLTKEMLRKAQRPKNLHHHDRQNRFLQMCMGQLQKEGWTWTSLWDTDEYILFNKVYQKTVDFSLRGSILDHVKKQPDQHCHSILRSLVGSKETKPVANSTVVYPGLDMRRLQTIRYRFHNRVFRNKMNGPQKTILNVQKVNASVEVITPHRPAPKICFPENQTTPFIMYHYLGSWEAYSFRDDYRKGNVRSYESWRVKQSRSKYYGVYLTNWLSGFIKQVGLEKVTRLLGNAGLDPVYNAVRFVVVAAAVAATVVVIDDVVFNGFCFVEYADYFFFLVSC